MFVLIPKGLTKSNTHFLLLGVYKHVTVGFPSLELTQILSIFGSSRVPKIRETWNIMTSVHT